MDKKPKNYCRYCKKTFKDIKEHHNAVHKKTKHICKICGDKFTRKNSLKRHIDTVHKKIKYKCEECGKEFVRKCVLKTHIKTVHEGKKYVCDICGKTFNTQRSVNRCKDVHSGKRYKCRYCGKEYRFQNNLYIHIQSAHKKKKYKCKICGKEYTLQSNLVRHVNIKHKKTKENSSYQKWHNKKKKCIICGKEVINGYFKRHIVTHAKIRYQCFCGRIVSDIYKHISRYHSNFLQDIKSKDGVVILTPAEERFAKQLKRKKNLRGITILDENYKGKKISINDLYEDMLLKKI